jgi:hypothetical protein
MNQEKVAPMNKATKAKSGGHSRRPKAPVGLIFAEDKNDADSLIHLTRAIWPEGPTLKYRRKPMVLVRDAQEAQARKKNADDIAGVVKAEAVEADVRLVIAHRDCDAVEPAHEKRSRAVKEALEAAGLENVVPAVPAWEIEAWWFLWPDAVASVHSKWTKLKRSGNHGMIKDAKEALRNDLKNNTTQRVYEESDSATIAEKVRNGNLIDQHRGTCASFTAFRDRIRVVAGLDEDPSEA